MKLRDMQILSAGYLLLSLLPSTGVSLCVIYQVTGEPCPGCGMTRAIHLLLTGNPIEAIRHNALSVLLLPMLLYFTSTVFWGGGARFYDAHRTLIGGGILVGAVVLLGYGVLRVLVLEGLVRLPGEPFAVFHEPALLRDWWRAFFH